MLSVMAEFQGWKDESARGLFAYERLTTRASQAGSTLWQAPGLALAAQAFLLTIALDPESTRVSVTIACLVGLLTSVMALQLMARRRYLADLDRADMQELERDLGLLPVSDRRRQQVRHPGERPEWLGSLSSFRVWQTGFLLIALIDIGVALDAWLPATWVIAGIGVFLLTWWGFVLLAALRIPVRR